MPKLTTGELVTVIEQLHLESGHPCLGPETCIYGNPQAATLSLF